MPNLYQLFKYVNNEGAKGNRLIEVVERPTLSAGDDANDRFIFIFDEGPKSAADKPFPK